MVTPLVGGSAGFWASVVPLVDESVDQEADPRMLESFRIFYCFADTIKSITFNSSKLAECLSLAAVSFLLDDKSLDKTLACSSMVESILASLCALVSTPCPKENAGKSGCVIEVMVVMVVGHTTLIPNDTTNNRMVVPQQNATKNIVELERD